MYKGYKTEGIQIMEPVRHVLLVASYDKSMAYMGTEYVSCNAYGLLVNKKFMTMTNGVIQIAGTKCIHSNMDSSLNICALLSLHSDLRRPNLILSKKFLSQEMITDEDLHGNVMINGSPC